MTAARNWTLWQLADSAFPGGSFAHSGGLEAAWKAGFIPDEAALTAALRAVLYQTAHGSLPLIHAVLADPAAFAPACRRADASLLNHVAHHASLAQGRALALAAPRIFPGLPAHLCASPDRPPPLHLAPVYGRLAHGLDLAPHDAAGLFVFNALRSALSAAVRLGITGPLRAQTLLAGCVADADDATARAGRTLDDVCATSPLLDLLQNQQQRLYSKLFQS